MKMYCVYDVQFNVHSDPFLAADDNAAERIVIQSAVVIPEVRARMHLNQLVLVADFESVSLNPVTVDADYPHVVSTPERLVSLCEASEHKLNKEDSE